VGEEGGEEEWRRGLESGTEPVKRLVLVLVLVLVLALACGCEWARGLERGLGVCVLGLGLRVPSRHCCTLSVPKWTLGKGTQGDPNWNMGSCGVGCRGSN
jgi:hypothetical protein